MLVKQARIVARQWARDASRNLPGFVGAYLAGSTIMLLDDTIVPPTSDLDVMIVLDSPDPPAKPGKLLFRDTLLDVTYLATDQLRSSEQVLAHYHLAGAFRSPSIVLDPTGYLTSLGASVASEFTRRHWVRKRCEHARDNVLRFFRSLDASDPLHDQVTAWLFGTGVTIHVLLVAGLKNPTVRQRYLAVRQLLSEYGCLGSYEMLLEMLGCARISRERVEQHLSALEAVFDVAANVVETPFFFASYISAIARPIAIDGSRDLIVRGYHREAIFWIVATYARCLKVLLCDASPQTRDQFAEGFRELLDDLGIRSLSDLKDRARHVEGHLRQVWEMAEAIMAANPEIDT